MTDDQFITTTEAAAYADVGLDAIRHAVARLRIRSSMVDGRRVIARADLERWMQDRKPDQQAGWRAQRHVPAEKGG